MNSIDYVYTSDNGTDVVVPMKVHEAIQKGHIFQTRNGKGALHTNCEWRLATGKDPVSNVQFADRGEAKAAKKDPAMPETPKAKRARVKKERAEKGPTKSSQVREAITKFRGHGQEYVIQWAISNLGMPKAQAAVYVKGNWDKAAKE